MTEAILSLCASLFSYLAARGIDLIVGKWLAYIAIAWEQHSSDASKKAYAAAMTDIKASSPEKAAAWDSWRKRAAQTTSGT